MPWRFDKLGIEPARIKAMHRAHEKACAALGLLPVSDRINEILVTKIVELSKTESDPERLCAASSDIWRRVPDPRSQQPESRLGHQRPCAGFRQARRLAAKSKIAENRHRRA
jgi:hypothetical protein